jgi:hypothetical protein
MRSDRILATNKMADSVALTESDILWPERKETSVRTKDATKSRLLNGVIGAAGFGSFLRRPKLFLTPATGSPQT